MITLTDSAKDYIYSIAVKNNKKIVTFGVLGGGCAGFSYKWDYAEEPIDGYSLFPIRDDIKLAVDKTSEMYIMGLLENMIANLGKLDVRHSWYLLNYILFDLPVSITFSVRNWSGVKPISSAHRLALPSDICYGKTNSLLSKTRSVL